MSEEPESRRPEIDEDPAVAWKQLADLLREAGRQSQSTETTEEIMDWMRDRQGHRDVHD